jgi:hypothetical protein
VIRDLTASTPVLDAPAPTRGRADRTQYVIVEPGGWNLHHSQWGASAVLADIVAGPEFAIQRISARHKSEPDAWFGDTECEAGLLVDPARRVLLFFGAHRQVMHLDLRAALFQVLARTWPGWTVLWAYGGLADLRAYVGAERRSEDSPAAIPLVDRRAFPVSVSQFKAPWWSDSIGTLVTVRHAAGAVLVHSLDRELAPVWEGPALVGRMPPGAHQLDAASWPACGVHLDLGRRAVSLWTASTFPGWRGGRFRALWSGWEVTFWQDRIGDQLVAAGGAVRVPPVRLPAGAVRLAHLLRDAWGEPVTVPELAWLGGLTPVVGPVFAEGVSAQALAEDASSPTRTERREVFAILHGIAAAGTGG